jgi:peptidoglycan/LPS O-acetylase OafA/YrhL
MQRARAICPEPVPFPFQGHDQNRGARECEVFLCIIVGTGEARPRNDPMNTTTPSLEHRPTLDGLRFLAFLGVFLFHIDEGVFPLGALGVKVFFALSGFLICRILILREGPSIHKNLRSFYWRRTLRIFPLYYAVLLGFRLFGGGLEGSRWQYGYAINFYVWRNGRWPVQLGHFWSLAVEEQFYVVFPLILYCSPRRHRAALILMLILVCEAVRFWMSGSRFVGLLPWVAGLAILMGCLAAMWELTGRRCHAAVLPCGIALIWLGSTVPVAGYDVQNFGCVAVVLGVWSAKGVVATVLSWRPIVYLGRISYGLYVFHLPILSWLRPLAPNPVVLGAVALAITVVVAATSWHFFERPILGLKSLTPMLPAIIKPSSPTDSHPT